MSKLGAALGYDMDMGGDEPPASMGEPPATDELEKPKADTGSAELMAMKMFTKASTPEAKVDALKAFLEACGAIGSDY